MYFPEYDSCNICPRKCFVNRNKGEKGFCKEDAYLHVAWAGLHFGEEPILTGDGGSGVIFIRGCNLACSFCQNYQISQEGMGSVVSEDLFASICLTLQKKGAHNINIVTGSHHTISIMEGLNLAKKRGLSLPIVWNTSSYEKISEIERLSKHVNIWLSDLKTLDSNLSFKYFNAKDYPEVAKNAILKMSMLSPLRYTTSSNLLLSGLIVRHLALPTMLDDTEDIIKWFSNNIKDMGLLSIMTQYTPIKKTGSFDRYLIKEEDESLRYLLAKYNIKEGFYQELLQDSSWLPDFKKSQPFSSKLAIPIWHWKEGFL